MDNLNTENEIWKDIEGFEGLYQVSNTGKVKTSSKIGEIRCRNNGEMKLQINHKGYSSVVLHKNSRPYPKLVHRLVAQAFIPNLENKAQVNHIDTNKLNNCVENLEWNTQEENMAHAAKHGIYKNKSDKQREAQMKNVRIAQEVGKRKVVQLNPITGELIAIFNSEKEANEKIGIQSTSGHIGNVCKGKREFCGNYKWAYYEDFINNTIPPYRGTSRKYPNCSNRGDTTVEQRENMAKEYEDGLTTREIANKYNVSLHTVRHAIKQFGNWNFETHNYGIDMNELAEEINSGMSSKELANKYKCSTNLISVKKSQLRKAGKVV